MYQPEYLQKLRLLNGRLTRKEVAAHLGMSVRQYQNVEMRPNTDVKRTENARRAIIEIVEQRKNKSEK
jgi:hypothetical protein